MGGGEAFCTPAAPRPLGLRSLRGAYLVVILAHVAALFAALLALPCRGSLLLCALRASAGATIVKCMWLKRRGAPARAAARGTVQNELEERRHAAPAAAAQPDEGQRWSCAKLPRHCCSHAASSRPAPGPAPGPGCCPRPLEVRRAQQRPGRSACVHNACSSAASRPEPSPARPAPACSVEEDRVLENALAQFWEHSDRCAAGCRGAEEPEPRRRHRCRPPSAPCFRISPLFKPSVLHPPRLEKCASLLSRKDLAAVKRRYQQLEVRRGSQGQGSGRRAARHSPHRSVAKRWRRLAKLCCAAIPRPLHCNCPTCQCHAASFCCSASLTQPPLLPPPSAAG